MLKRLRELCGGTRKPHQLPTNLRGVVEQLLAVPAEMFARNPDSGLLAVEAVNGIKMCQDHITQVGAQKRRRRFLPQKISVDSAEDPWRTVTCAADHYSVRLGEIKYVARFFFIRDVAVRENRNCDARLDRADRFVLGLALIKVRPRAAMHRQRGNTTCLRDAGNVHAIAVVAIPA